MARTDDRVNHILGISRNRLAVGDVEEHIKHPSNLDVLLDLVDIEFLDGYLKARDGFLEPVV